MIRRILLATVLAAASTMMAVPTSSAGPATTQCPTTDGTNVGVKVSAGNSPATITVQDLQTNSPVSAVVTISGTQFQIAPTDPSVVLLAVSWCAKSSVTTSTVTTGTTLTGSSPSTNKKSVAQNIGYVSVYSVTSEGPTACYDSANGNDVKRIAPVGQYGNLQGVASFDGTCSGAPGSGTPTAVRAASDWQAADLCGAFGQSLAFNLANEGWLAPPDLWVCI